MVVRSRGVGRRLSDLPDVGGQPREARAVRRGRRPHLPRRLRPQGQDADVQPRGRRAVRDQFGAREEECHRGRSVGDGLAQQQRGRRRRLSGGELEARQRDDPRALRQLEERPAAEDPARHRPRRPLPRDAARDARARRRRHLDRLSAEGLRPDDQGGQGQGRWRADPERALVRRAQHRAPAVRQRQAAAGDRLGDAVRADPGERVLRPGQADVWRRHGRGAGGMAAAALRTAPISTRRRR